MSYMADPERKRVALEKQAATRERLGPRLGHANTERRPPTAPPMPGRERRGLAGPAHPTRDSPA